MENSFIQCNNPECQCEHKTESDEEENKLFETELKTQDGIVFCKSCICEICDEMRKMDVGHNEFETIHEEMFEIEDMFYVCAKCKEKYYTAERSISTNV